MASDIFHPSDPYQVASRSRLLNRVGDQREREWERVLEYNRLQKERDQLFAPSPSTPTQRWRAWLQASWPALVRGDRVAVSHGQLPHPSLAGFRGLRVSENAGQVADWGLSLQDGSRVHLHEFADNALVAHRDRFDPGQNLYSLGRHVVTETRAGRIAAVGALLWGAARAVGGFL